MQNIAGYKVVEDDGGGLTLYVFGPDETVIYSYARYENCQGQLLRDLDALDAEVDITQWEECEANPQESWDRWKNHEHGWNVVASGKDGQRTLYPDKMGNAAQSEFGLRLERLKNASKY